MIDEQIQRGWRRPNLYNKLLYPLSLGYAGFMRARSCAYQCGVLRSYDPPAPLIVVGNLSVGGAGKTPLVIALVAALRQRGLRPGVIARGYGGRARAPRLVQPDDTYREVGDEPILIARAGGAPVAVGRDRARCAQWMLAHHNCDVVISDDGFQHLQLRRTADIVVVDGEQRFGNGWCLPAGPLREPPDALRRADWVVLHNPPAATGAADDDAPDEDAPDEDANMPAASPQVIMTTRIARAHRLDDMQTRDLTEFRGRTAHAVAALGNPRRFFQQLRQFGIHIIAHVYRDHHPFAAADLRFAEPPDAPVLMTEKDAVKCEPLIAAGALRPDNYWKIPLTTELPEDFIAAVAARIKQWNNGRWKNSA